MTPGDYARWRDSLTREELRAIVARANAGERLSMCEVALVMGVSLRTAYLWEAAMKAKVEKLIVEGEV